MARHRCNTKKSSKKSTKKSTSKFKKYEGGKKKSTSQILRNERPNILVQEFKSDTDFMSASGVKYNAMSDAVSGLFGGPAMPVLVPSEEQLDEANSNSADDSVISEMGDNVESSQPTSSPVEVPTAHTVGQPCEPLPHNQHHLVTNLRTK